MRIFGKAAEFLIASDIERAGSDERLPIGDGNMPQQRVGFQPFLALHGGDADPTVLTMR